MASLESSVGLSIQVCNKCHSPTHTGCMYNAKTYDQKHGPVALWSQIIH